MVQKHEVNGRLPNMVTIQHLEEFKSAQSHRGLRGLPQNTLKWHQESETRAEKFRRHYTSSLDPLPSCNLSREQTTPKQSLYTKNYCSNFVLSRVIPMDKRLTSSHGTFHPIRTNEEIQEVVYKKIASIKARRHSTDHNLPRSNDKTSHLPNHTLTETGPKVPTQTSEPSWNDFKESARLPSMPKERPSASRSTACLTEYLILREGVVECRKIEERTPVLPIKPSHTLSNVENPPWGFNHTQEKIHVRNPQKILKQTTIIQQKLQSHHAISEKELFPSKINLSNENKLEQSPYVLSPQQEEKLWPQGSFKLEDSPQSCSKKSPIVFNELMYEDVSDAESQTPPDKKLADPDSQESSISVVCEDDCTEEESFPEKLPKLLKYPMYEDISDVEDHKPLGKKLASPDFCAEKEIPFLPNTSPLKHNVFKCDETDIQIISDDEPIPDTKSTDIGPKCGCPYLVETENGFECLPCPKCQNKKAILSSSQSERTKSLSFSESVKAHLDGQTSPVSILEKNDQDDLEDDWLVIPLVISDIRLDYPYEDQIETEILSAQGEGGDEENKLWGTPFNRSPSNSFHQSQCFNTAESCGQVQGVGHENKAHISMSCGNSDPHSDTSNDTEDSCNYSPTQERNLLTVPRQIWASRRLSEPSHLKTEDFHLEKQYEHEMTNTQREKKKHKTLKRNNKLKSDSDEDSETRNKARKKPSIEKRKCIGYSVTNPVSCEDVSNETSGKKTSLSVDAGNTSGVKFGKKNGKHDPFENDMQPVAFGLQFDKIDGQSHKVKSSSNYALTIKSATKAYKRKRKSGKLLKRKAISRRAKKVRALSSSAATEDTEDACSNASDSFGGGSKDDSVKHDKLAGGKDDTLTFSKRISEITKEQSKAPIKKAKPVDYVSAENETEDSEDVFSDESDNISNVKKIKKGAFENSRALTIEKCGFEANQKRQASKQHVEQCLPSTSKPLDETFNAKPEAKSCQGVSGFRQQLSKYIQRRCFSYPSSSNSSILLSANDKVTEVWKGSYVETKIRRRASLGREDFASQKNSASKLVPSTSHFPRAPKKRHSSQKSETPLMKKTRSEAKERTRDIKCHRLKHQSNQVAPHYKWKEPEDKAVSRRRKRCPSPSLLEDWE